MSEQNTALVEAPDPFQGRSPSLAEYEAYRTTGKVEEKAVATKVEEKAPPAAAEKSEAKPPEGEEPSKTEQEKREQERDEHGRFKKVEFSPEQQEVLNREIAKAKRKFQREFEERYAKTSEKEATPAEKKAETASAPPEEPKLPKLSEYKGTVEEFEKEVAEFPAKHAAWMESQRTQTEKAQAVQQKLSQSEAKARKTYPDYEEVTDALFRDVKADEEPKLPPHVLKGIAEESDDPHSLTYYLAKNRDEFRRMTALKPEQVLREVVKLDARIALTPAPVEKPKPAKPKPVETVNTRQANTGFDVNDEKLSPDEWRARREEQLAARRRALS